MSILITVDSAVRALKDAVAEKGEQFVYEKEEGLAYCAYIHGVGIEYDSDNYAEEPTLTSESTPGCMVGNALVRLGVPMEEFLPFNDSDDANGALQHLRHRGVIRFEDYNAELDIKIAYTKAQSLQDQKYPWGEALQGGLDTLKDRIG